MTQNNVVECMYAIDLGVQTGPTDENGEVIGSYRTYYYGATLFVPEVAPSRATSATCWPRTVSSGNPALPSYEEYRCRLLPPVADKAAAR